MKGEKADFRDAMKPAKRRALQDTSSERLLNLAEPANADIPAEVEHPLRMIKNQW
jgi:hypothetical protein